MRYLAILMITALLISCGNEEAPDEKKMTLQELEKLHKKTDQKMKSAEGYYEKREIWNQFLTIVHGPRLRHLMANIPNTTAKLPFQEDTLVKCFQEEISKIKDIEDYLYHPPKGDHHLIVDIIGKINSVQKYRLAINIFFYKDYDQAKRLIFVF